MQSTNIFDTQLARLKKVLELKEDQDAASALGMTKAALSARKVRNAFPEEKLYALAAKCPELDIDVDYVLTGITAAARGLGDAARARMERASDAGMDFEQLRALAAAEGPGPSPERINKLAAMLLKLRATEFEAIYTMAQSITELRDAWERSAKGR